MKFKYLILLLLLILIGCAERPAVVTPNQQRFSHTLEIRIEVEKLINDPFPQTNPSEIQIFVSEKDVEKPFEKIAIKASMTERMKKCYSMKHGGERRLSGRKA